MGAGMVTPAEDDQVLGVIVEAIVIPVMDVFILAEGTPDSLGHEDSMFIFPASAFFGLDQPVSSTIRRFSKASGADGFGVGVLESLHRGDRFSITQTGFPSTGSPARQRCWAIFGPSPVPGEASVGAVVLLAGSATAAGAEVGRLVC